MSASRRAESTTAAGGPSDHSTAAATRAAADTRTGRQSGVTSISLGDFIGHQVAVDPATDTAYVAMLPRSTSETPSVDVIDLATGTVAATVPVGPNAQSLAVDPDTDMIYVVDSGSNSISVIDGATNTVTAIIGLTGFPANSMYGIAVDPATDMIYAGLGHLDTSAEVAVINGATNTLADTISAGLLGFPESVSVDPLTDTIYAGFFGVSGNPNLSVINGATQSVTSLIDTNGFPEAIAVDPVTNVFYVGNYGETVTAYSGASNAVLGAVSVGGLPRGVAANPDTDTVYATPTIDISNVTLISGTDNSVAATIPENVAGPIAVDPTTDTVVTDTTAAGGWYLTVIPLQAPSITSAASATFTTGQAGSFSFESAGTPVPSLSVSGSLPAGVTVSSSGTLAGTPGAGTGGSYSLIVTAANGVDPAVKQAFTLYVRQAPAIVSAVSVTFKHGVSGTFMLQATGFPVPGLAVIGALPPGLSLIPGTNGTLTISGTPASSDAGHVYLLRIIASNGVGLTANQHFTITVS